MTEPSANFSMFRFPLPDNWSLLLTPRFGSLGEFWQPAVLAVLVLVPLGLLVWLYRYEMKLVRGSTAALLLSLRLLVIVALWFVVAWQPVIARTTREELPGRVLLALDQSESMGVADPQRSFAEKLRLAKALNLHPQPALEAGQLERWLAHYEKNPTAAPVWVTADESGDLTRRQQLARQRQTQHDELCRQVDQLTRAEITRRVLSSAGLNLLARLQGKHKVEALAFHKEAWAVEGTNSAALISGQPKAPTSPPQTQNPSPQPPQAQNPSPPPPPRSGEGEKRDLPPQPPSLKGKGERARQSPSPLRGGVGEGLLQGAVGEGANAGFTDLRQPFLRALELSGPDRGRVLGLVLFSDGQHNWGDSPLKQASELAGRKVPVQVIALGAKDAPPDVAVLEMTAPANVFKDVDASIETRIRISGLPAQEVIVELHEGKKPVDDQRRRVIQHDGTERVYPLTFQIKMEQVGNQQVEVKVRTTKATPPETTLDNNQRSRIIRVASDRARVLLIDGEARWEFHYLHKALLRDKIMAPDAVVFWQPRLGQLKEADLDKAGQPKLQLPELPKDREKGDPLARYDCIILGDVTPEQLPLTHRQRLEKYVADSGGTLVLLAGKRGLPLGFTANEKGEPDPLQRLLPIEKPRVVSPREGFPLTLTQEGSTTSYLQMDPAPEVSALRWAELPRHYWGVIGKAKPGAAPLAFLQGEQFKLREMENKEDKDGPERTQSLIVKQNYGFGRVIFVGLDSTWRWRFRVGDLYHHRFWGQLIRWAASDKLLPAGNRYVRYGSRDPVYQQGKEVEVVVRLEDETVELPPGAVARARLLRQGASGKEEAAALVTLTASPAQPRVLQAQVRDLPAGEYRLELDIPSLADKLKLPDPDQPEKEPTRRDTFLITPSESSELYRLATNWPLLEAIAARTGGQVLTPDRADALVEMFGRQVISREQREEQRVWQDQPLAWYVLGFFLVLLTIEWVTRKLVGLP